MENFNIPGRESSGGVCLTPLELRGKLKMQFNSIYLQRSLLIPFSSPFLSRCRSSRTGSSSPWCWTASSSGCSFSHALAERSALSSNHHRSTILAFQSISSSARFHCEKIILCCHQMLFELTSTRLTLGSSSSPFFRTFLNFLLSFSSGTKLRRLSS